MSISLNDRISMALGNHSETAVSLWNTHSPIVQGQGIQEDLRRVNNFLRIQLGLLDIDTTEERCCLSNNCDLNEWIENFEDVVLPTILKYGLPVWGGETI